MSRKKRSQRAAGQGDDALAKAFEAFPRFLAQCDPEAAARIVADLLKVRLASPADDQEGAEPLRRYIRAIAAENGEVYEG